MSFFTRVNFANKSRDTRACETCAFAERRTYGPERTDAPCKTEIRCHRNPPVKQADGHEHFFPIVGPKARCGDWKKDDGAPRDTNGVPHKWRCDTCRHSGVQAGSCQLKAPGVVSHEGAAIFPRVGCASWCGRHELEDGLDGSAFQGAVPPEIYALGQRKAG